MRGNLAIFETIKAKSFEKIRKKLKQSQKRSLPKTRPKKKPAIDFLRKVLQKPVDWTNTLIKKIPKTIVVIPVSVRNCPRDGAWLGTLAGSGDS